MKLRNFAALALTGYATARMLARKARRISFTDKVVVITGGSRGLGLVLARQFAAEGARIVIAGRDQDELERARQELMLRHARVAAVQCNVRLKTDCDALIRSA